MMWFVVMTRAYVRLNRFLAFFQKIYVTYIKKERKLIDFVIFEHDAMAA
jgi:hypothetical protein